MSINLTAGIPGWFVDQFSDTLYHVCQQKTSKFQQAVKQVPIVGAEDKSFDLMGTLELVEKTGRAADTPYTEPSAGRRWVSTTPYHNSVRYDQDDDLSMLLDPLSDFNIGFAAAAERKKDDIILASIFGSVTSGRRAGSTITWASESGTVKYTMASGGRTIAHDTSEGNCKAADTGMTVEKIELVKEYFALHDADENLPIWGAISPRQATNMFGQAQYVSSDYNNDKPLATGRIIRNWHGINWIVSNKIVIGSSNDVDADTNVYNCPFWIQDGIILGVAKEMSISIDKLPEKSQAQQVYAHLNMGAGRMDEDKVCCVECQG